MTLQRNRGHSKLHGARRACTSWRLRSTVVSREFGGEGEDAPTMEASLATKPRPTRTAWRAHADAPVSVSRLTEGKKKYLLRRVDLRMFLFPKRPTTGVGLARRLLLELSRRYSTFYRRRVIGWRMLYFGRRILHQAGHFALLVGLQVTSNEHQYSISDKKKKKKKQQRKTTRFDQPLLHLFTEKIC